MKNLVLFGISNIVLFSACSQSVDANAKFLALQNQKYYAIKPGCPDTLSWIHIKNDSVLLHQTYWHPDSYRLDRLTYTLGESTDKDSLYLFIHKQEFAFGQDTVFQEVVNMGKTHDWLQRVWVKPEIDALLFVYQKYPFEGRPGHENVFTTVRLYVNHDVFKEAYFETNEIEGKFILPDGFTGRGLIALNQADGLEPEYDMEGIPIYRIGPNGLLATQHPENPFMMAKGTYKFYFIESEKQTLIEIPALYNDCRQSLTHDYTVNGEFSDERYRLDDIYVLVTRYNPAPNVIDEEFGKTTLGNVKIFRVDTLKNFLLR
ncbi:MAG: hypothetical protein EA361_14590 [Bacteroidetes bacterium]|nr:MAG: hypothetical protein EA361_14590 [Bacteroidota bacterium]